MSLGVGWRLIVLQTLELEWLGKYSRVDATPEIGILGIRGNLDRSLVDRVAKLHANEIAAVVPESSVGPEECGITKVRASRTPTILYAPCRGFPAGKTR
jgi:hypothetical protein